MEPNFSPIDRIAPRLANFFLATVVLLYLGFIGISNWAG